MDFDHQVADEDGSAAVNLSQFLYTVDQEIPKISS